MSPSINAQQFLFFFFFSSSCRFYPPGQWLPPHFLIRHTWILVILYPTLHTLRFALEHFRFHEEVPLARPPGFCPPTRREVPPRPAQFCIVPLWKWLPISRPPLNSVYSYPTLCLSSEALLYLFRQADKAKRPPSLFSKSSFSSWEITTKFEMD